MYDEFSFFDRDSFISKKMEYVKAKKIEDNMISIIIFDNIMNVKISGQASEFKKYIRGVAMNLLKTKDSELRGNDIMHINDHFYQTVNYCEMLLNKNRLICLITEN